ncbi:MAG: hypothetical protein JXB03_03105 [Spirochaetales bacterium]|nr:hypothetical protein [Spirochaetales bacterium]
MDFRFLVRQGFLLAYGVVLLVYFAVLTLLPPGPARSGFLVFAVYSDTAIVGFFFSAAMMFLEKDQNLLVNWYVLPAGFRYYTCARLVTFSVLSLAISLCLYLPFMGIRHITGFSAGVFASVILNIPVGMMLAAKVKKLLNFLLVSVLVLLPQMLPLLDYFGVYRHRGFRLLPGYGVLLLLGGGQDPIAGGIGSWYVIPTLVCSALFTWCCGRYLDRKLRK